MATTTPNFGWDIPQSTDLVKDGATAIAALGNDIDTSMVDLKGGTTGQVLSKASNTDMDFTWVAQDDSNAIQNTIVDAKGDLISATAADTPARLAVGTDGQVLTADSSTATGLKWAAASGNNSGDYAAGKNKIINGDFGIWQRGTSFTNPAAAAYTADRFYMDYSSGTVNCVVSQQAFTAGTAPVAGYEGSYFLRISQSAATASKTIYLVQRVEDVRTFANQTVTLSFWAKANASKTISTRIVQGFGSGGSSAVVTSGSSNSITTSWTRFTNTITIPSIAGKTIGTSNYLQVDFSYDSNAIQDIDIWGVQLEAGSTATPFQTATGTIQGELAACQRYYYRTTNSTGNGFGQGVGASTTIGEMTIRFPVTMRTAPSALDNSNIGIYQVSSGTDYSGGTTTMVQAEDDSAFVRYTHGSAVLTQGNVNVFKAAGGTGYLGFSAEL